MASAIGGQSTRPSWGTRTVDIRDFGARPNDPTCNNTLAIQKAHDSLLDANGLAGQANGSTGILFVPSGTWYVSSPVWIDGDHVHLRGEGLQSEIKSNSASPPLVFGKKRLEIWADAAIPTWNSTTAYVAGNQVWNSSDGKVYTCLVGNTNSRPPNANWSFQRFSPLAKMAARFTGDHRWDLFGTWDNSLSGANQLWGLTNLPQGESNSLFQADHFIAMWGTPPCTGKADGWAATQKLRIEIGLVNPVTSASPLYKGPIMGMGSSASPSPWFFRASNTGLTDTQFHFLFRTHEGGFGADGTEYVRELVFGDLTQTGPQRLSLEMDFTANDGSGLCKVKAAQNGRQVAVTRGFGTRLTTATGSEPSFKAADGLHFTHNEMGLFTIASEGTINKALSGITPLAIFGLRIAVDNVYNDVGTGNVATRIDAATITDSVRYTNPGFDMATTVCLLPMNEPPNDASKVTDRLIKVSHGQPLAQGSSYALWQTSSQDFLASGGGTESVQDNRLYDLALTSADPTAGIGCLSWLTFDFHAYRCKLMGSWWGMVISGGYDYIFDACLFNGNDCALVGQACIAKINDNIRQSIGRTFAMFTGSNINWENLRTGSISTNTDYVVEILNASDFGFKYRFNGIGSDNEGFQAPRKAFILCQGHTPITILEINQTEPGSIPAGVPLVDLQEGAAGTGPHLFYSTGGLLPGVVGIRTNGSGWVSELFNVSEGSYWRINTGTDGQSNVKVNHRRDAKPTSGIWEANADQIEIRHPAAAGVRTYLCTQSGIATWSSTTAYNPGDLVYQGGSVYRCSTASTNSVPPSSNWAVIPPWSSTATYHYGDLVTSGGRIWIAWDTHTNIAPSTIGVGADHWNPLGLANQAMFSPLNTVGTAAP